MKLTPEDDESIPSRAAFTGVGSSRPSLRDSPVDENVDFWDETNDNDAGSENLNEDHSGVKRPLVPVSNVVEDKGNSENDTVDDNDHPSSDHHSDVNAKVVSTPNQGDNDVGNVISTSPEHSENGIGDAEEERTEFRSIEHDVKDDVDDDIGQTSQSKDDVVDDSDFSGESEDKGLTPMQEDENDIADDHHHDASILHPKNEPSPTNSAMSLQGSKFADPQRSSTPLQSRDPSQQGSNHSLRSSASRRQGSSCSLRSSTSRRHGETSRRYSGSSRRTIRSGRSSSGSSASASSSSGSSSGSDSSSCSSDSNSESESDSSSASSSSYSTGDSNATSSDSQSTSSGSGSASSSSSDDGEVESDANSDQRYLISSKRYERTSSRGSGPSSSFSFAPDGYADVSRKDKKSRGKRSRKTAKSSHATSMPAQRRRYEERDRGEHYQDTCSTVCIIL